MQTRLRAAIILLQAKEADLKVSQLSGAMTK